MTPSRLLLALPLLVQLACIDGPSTIVERQVDKTFAAAPGSLVQVDLSGGSVNVATSMGREVHVVVRQEVTSGDGDAGADRLLAAYELKASASGGTIQVLGRRVAGRPFWTNWKNRVRINAMVTVPADVRLDLNTSGGRVRIDGERDAEVRANTSGGSVDVAGGVGPLTLTTSGGRITVTRALGIVRADTSGGSIRVDYVGPSARYVDLNTAGGNIRVGVDDRAALTVSASTAGGSVNLEGLAFEGASQRRSSISGTINGGRDGNLRASTSGGNITLTGAVDPGGPGRRARNDDAMPARVSDLVTRLR